MKRKVFENKKKQFIEEIGDLVTKCTYTKFDWDGRDGLICLEPYGGCY